VNQAYTKYDRCWVAPYSRTPAHAAQPVNVARDTTTAAAQPVLAVLKRNGDLKSCDPARVLLCWLLSLLRSAVYNELREIQKLQIFQWTLVDGEERAKQAPRQLLYFSPPYIVAIISNDKLGATTTLSGLSRLRNREFLYLINQP
jgi:hypothetical protein